MSERATVVIAIDGPAGAGKSSVARRLAEELGFDFLDTGALYRSVTLATLRRGIDPQDESAVAELARGLRIELDGPRVALDGEDVATAIRDPSIGSMIGRIADNVAVRRHLTEWQRRWTRGRRVVTEGRDQGSEVFPDAPCKFFLVASSHERAMRRMRELNGAGVDCDYATLREQQERRDREDYARPIGGLRKADDAIEFSTDGMELQEVVAELARIARERVGLEDSSNGVPHRSDPTGPPARAPEER